VTVRQAAHDAQHRLLLALIPTTEMTVAATLAWVIDTELVGHTAPFFAPAAAIIVLSQARGHRWRRAAEVVLGVAGGVLVADLVAKGLGPHHWWTILVLVLVPLLIAAAMGLSAIFSVQAAVSALYVAVIAAPSNSIVPFRFVDALVGGGIALVISQLAVVRDPIAQLDRDLDAVLGSLADVILSTAAALEQRDAQLALRALQQARTLDASVEHLRGALVAAEEALLFHPRQRLAREGVRELELATTQLDYIVRGGRVLARAGVTLTRRPEPTPPEVIEALRSLAAVLRPVDAALTARMNGDEAGRLEAARAVEDEALQVLRVAGTLVPPTASLPLVTLIGQLRTMTIDMFRAVGADSPDMLRRVDDALGDAPR
jgi:uncharacterized membrane protein YgaE (UPF0421/DUF939 family)